MSTARRSLAALLAAIALVVATAPPGSAHAWPDWYTNGRWAKTWIDVWYDESYELAGPEWRARSGEAFARWSSAIHDEVRFVPNAGVVAVTSDQSCNNGYAGVVVRREPTTSYLGYATNCSVYENGRWVIVSSTVTITSDPRHSDNSACPWYSGDGFPARSSCDLASTLAHEAGHVLGHTRHWDGVEPSLCPHDGAHTMCVGVYGNDTSRRSLHDHDIGTARNAYGVDWPPPPPPTTTTTTQPPKPGGSGVPSCQVTQDADVLDPVRECLPG